MFKPIKLSNPVTFNLTPTSPFHFDATFHNPSHFSTQDSKWEPGKRRQTMLWQGETLGIIFENAGTVDKPVVIVKIFSDKKLTEEFFEELKKELIWRFNLNLDLSQFYQDLGDDPLLSPVIEKFKGLRPMHYGSLYEYLIVAIMLQNATVRRSVSMHQALFERYGTLVAFNGEKLWGYWQPQSLAKADELTLRNLKVGYRAKTLIRVSAPFASGEVDEAELRKKSEDEQEGILLSFYGIGPQSVGYIMIDVFHRWGYLKHISPWERKILTHIIFNKDHEAELVSEKEMLQFLEKWGQWRALALHYLWEDIWWKRKNEHLPWLEKEIRL